MAEKVKVIAVLGASYCGSTVLSLILDSHPNIYGGGELHWLLEGKKPEAGYKPICRNCEESCSYWTSSAFEEIDAKGFYPYVGNLFGVRVIVDTSKMESWFEEIRRHCPEEEVEFTYLMLVKHPVRHIASFIVNTEKKGQLKGWFRNIKRRIDIRKHINNLYDYYMDSLNKFGQFTEGSLFCIIQYEKMVLDLKATLMPLIDFLGLHYDPLMGDCYSLTHHIIGGNGGALYQLSNKWQGEPPEDIHPVRREYYEKRKGIFLDNKYKKVFSPSEVRWIQKQRKVVKLLDMLSYDPL